jgi:hypothetical protein
LVVALVGIAAFRMLALTVYVIDIAFWYIQTAPTKKISRFRLCSHRCIWSSTGQFLQ